MANVLVVDDDPSILRIIARTLSADGHDVTTAESRAEALVHIQGGMSIDVFILDFWLGVDSGLDVMSDLLQHHPDAPVIFLSGGHQDVALETSTALAEMQGACEFLYKPVETKELLEAVNRHL